MGIRRGVKLTCASLCRAHRFTLSKSSSLPCTGGGTFVLSVEHPIFTALAAQDWYYGQHGERLHWPVDHYQEEGPRQARFLGHDVVKYHRTVATYMNALIGSGFTITHLTEPQPTQAMLDE